MWSPPIDRRWVAASSASSAPASICAIASCDVERVARDVAGIGHLLRRERLDVERGMVGAEEPGPALRTRLGPEAGPGAVGHAAVEGDPEDGDVADVDVLAAREPREGRGPREARDDERVERPHR